MPPKFKLQSCPKRATTVPFNLRAPSRGTEVYACPSCGVLLQCKSQYRVAIAGFLGAGIAVVLSLLPMWIAIPATVIVVAYLVRWALELNAKHESK